MRGNSRRLAINQLKTRVYFKESDVKWEKGLEKRRDGTELNDLSPRFNRDCVYPGRHEGREKALVHGDGCKRVMRTVRGWQEQAKPICCARRGVTAEPSMVSSRQTSQ